MVSFQQGKRLHSRTSQFVRQKNAVVSVVPYHRLSSLSGHSSKKVVNPRLNEQAITVP